MSRHIILTLQNPLDDSDTLDLKYNVLDTTIGNQWFDHCVSNVKNEPRIEKNFCWLGWKDPNRDVPYLVEKLDKCVDTINEFAEAAMHLKRLDGIPNIWKDYYIEKNWDDISSDDALNQLHHHFEILMGPVWDPANYMRLANPVTAYAIRQLNNLVHELQSRKNAEMNINHSGMTVVSYLNPVRELFADEYYDSFSLNRDFGDILLHYAQTGKTPIEAFEDNDAYVFNNNINALRYMSGEFNIWWSDSSTDHEITNKKEKLREWLLDREVVLQEHDSFCYYVDNNGDKQGIGWLAVAKIEHEFDSEEELKAEVVKRLNIYKLACYEDDTKITDITWDYKWSDSDYIDNEIEYLTPLFPVM